jgi:unsaturated rhamnogalacturonyl hydrolase
MVRPILVVAFAIAPFFTRGQTWVDSVEQYAMQRYLPASKYTWTWQHAAFLNTMVKRYHQTEADKKAAYLNYVTKAMHRTMAGGNGKTPNAVASGLGLAFLLAKTGEDPYRQKCEKIFEQYMLIRRTPEGGVSHLPISLELWDDTVFMVGQFLMAMYKATGDEKYLTELGIQMRVHREKLRDEKTGLWVHGWDANQKDGVPYFCGQMGWPDDATRRSAEIWGRGNGWIFVTLSDALETIPREHPMWTEFAGYLKEMTLNLPALQDEATGHWFQLPVRNTDPDNFIESSCTAMFAYGIISALKLGIIEGAAFERSVDMAYRGLRQHSIRDLGNGHLTATNVCIGTCIGDKDYYLKRGVQEGRSFGLAMFIQFGMRYEIEKGLR